MLLKKSLCISIELPGIMDALKTRAQLIALKNDGGSSSCVGVSCASPSVPSEELNLSPSQVSYSGPKQVGFLLVPKHKNVFFLNIKHVLLLFTCSV